jgi:hypothetical protein
MKITVSRFLVEYDLRSYETFSHFWRSNVVNSYIRRWICHLQQSKGEEPVKKSFAKKGLIVVLGGIITLLFAQTQVNDLVKLSESGVDDGVLVAYIQSSPQGPALSADDIVALKNAGISDAVISEAVRHSVAAPEKQTGSLNTAGGASAPSSAQIEKPATGSVDKTVFEEALTPYGTWVLIGGVRYWQPGVAANNPGWTPYMSNGHWEYTDCGWAWVSNYPWGWAPFHYGRWMRHSVYGWVWWPDVTWGPAWVRWRDSDDFCGWAPLPPYTVFVPNHGLFFHGRFVDDDFDFGLVTDDFYFVPVEFFCDMQIWKHRVTYRERHRLYRNTVVVRNNFRVDNQRIVNHGPSVEIVARAAKISIRPMVIETHDVGRPGPSFKGTVVTPGRIIFERPHVTVSAPVPPIPHPSILPSGAPRPPIAPMPGAVVETHQSRSVEEPFVGGFHQSGDQRTAPAQREGLKKQQQTGDAPRGNAGHHGFQPQSREKSSGFRTTGNRQDGREKGFHERRGNIRKNRDD